jgi:hypothetical protein
MKDKCWVIGCQRDAKVPVCRHHFRKRLWLYPRHVKKTLELPTGATPDRSPCLRLVFIIHYGRRVAYAVRTASGPCYSSPC